MTPLQFFYSQSFENMSILLNTFPIFSTGNVLLESKEAVRAIRDSEHWHVYENIGATFFLDIKDRSSHRRKTTKAARIIKFI